MLSLAVAKCRLVLVKSMLESIPVYWMSIAHIPKGILHEVRKKLFSFLRSGRKDKERIHLVNWSILSRAKEHGGWDLKNIDLFGQALGAKCLWRLLFSKGM